MQAWLAKPRDVGFTEAEVRDTLLLDHAPLVRHGVDVLDAADKATGETVPVDLSDGGEVVWAFRPPDDVAGGADATTDVAAVRRTATLNLTGPVDVPIFARRFRPWVEMLSPEDRWVRFHLGVFVATLPPVVDDGVLIRRSLELVDKSHRYRRLLADTVSIPPGTNLVQWVIDMLAARFGETSFSIPASTFTSTEGYVQHADGQATWLDVLNSVLQTAAYDQLTVDANGRPRARPLSEIAGRASEHTYGPAAGKIVVAGRVESLLPTVPNVLRFVARQGPSLAEDGNGIRIVRNQSTGPASIDERGEEDELVVEVDAEDQTELDQIAVVEAQRYFAGGGLRFSGQVGLNPRHGDRDVITLDKPRLGLSGEWLVTEWRLPLRRITSADAVLMSLTCEQRVDVSTEEGS